jgi:hypothetical protein
VTPEPPRILHTDDARQRVVLSLPVPCGNHVEGSQPARRRRAHDSRIARAPERQALGDHDLLIVHTGRHVDRAADVNRR